MSAATRPRKLYAREPLRGARQGKVWAARAVSYLPARTGGRAGKGDFAHELLILLLFRGKLQNMAQTQKYKALKPMTGKELLPLLERYSRGEISATSLRIRMNNATYGEVLMAMGAADLPLPEAPQQGREDRLALAKSWLFPVHG
jgi:hypothetical protein